MKFSLQDLLGMRSRILAKTTTKKLISSDRQLVCFGGEPVGVIQRRPGSMLWFSPKRRVPYHSKDDAAMSIVSEVFMAYREGGFPAVTRLIDAARDEAEEVDRAIQEMDEASDIMQEAIDELGLEGPLE